MPIKDMNEGDYVLRNAHRVEATRDIVRRLGQTPAAIAAYARRDAIRSEIVARAAFVLDAAGRSYRALENGLIADGIARRTNVIAAGDLTPSLTGALSLQDNIWPAVAAKAREPDWMTTCLRFSIGEPLEASMSFLDFSPVRQTIYKPFAHHPIGSLASAREIRWRGMTAAELLEQQRIEALLSDLDAAIAAIVDAYAEFSAIVALVDGARTFCDLVALYPRAAQIEALRPRTPEPAPTADVAEAAHALQTL